MCARYHLHVSCRPGGSPTVRRGAGARRRGADRWHRGTTTIRGTEVPAGLERRRAPRRPAHGRAGAHRVTAVLLAGLALAACTKESAAPTPTPAAESAATAAESTAPAGSSSDRPVPASAPSASDAAHFATLPPGSTLPSDDECTARVRPAKENRDGNAKFNQTVGGPTAPNPPYFELAGRVTGNFTGTTDEIIQWTACKWGIDEDVVRAQIAKESWWHQDAAGDFSSDPATCAPNHPIGADGKDGQCPESIGLGQVRAPFYKDYIDHAVASSAYNLDVTYGIWRSCFEGTETWLNDVEHGQPYAAGDLWGCVGRWFAGRWYTAAGAGLRRGRAGLPEAGGLDDEGLRQGLSVATAAPRRVGGRPLGQRRQKSSSSIWPVANRCLICLMRVCPRHW